MGKTDIDAIVRRIGETMLTFGGGHRVDPMNPVTKWMKNQPLCFAMGVDVRTVVEFVLAEAQAKTFAARQNAKKKRPKARERKESSDA